MSKNTTIQYQQNIDIIKNFFRKPVVLILGILTIIASVANSVIEYLSIYEFEDIIKGLLGQDGYSYYFHIGGTTVPVLDSSNSTDAFSLDLLAIAMGVSLILLFAFGRSRSNAIQGGMTFFRVVCNIYYVAYFIVAVCAALMVIFSFAMEIDNLVKIILIVSFLVIGVFMLLYGHSMLQFAKGAKESMNSIYLSNSGAKVHGVLRIILAVAIGLAGTFGVIVAVEFASFDPASIIFSIIPVVLMITTEVLWAVFALKYHSYINGVISGKIEMPTDKEDDEEKICIVCGCPLTDEDVYCSVCGTKVE